MAGLTPLVSNLTPDAGTRLAQADAEVRGYCGWHIAPEITETVRVEGDGGRLLPLPSLYVTVVSSVVDEDGNAVTGWRWRRNGILIGQWRDCVAYDVTFTHGYDETPLDVAAATQAIASGDVALGVLRQKVAGPFSETYGTDAREAATRATLDRYKLPPRP